MIEKPKKDGAVWYVHAATLDSYLRAHSNDYATHPFRSLAKESEIELFHKLVLREDAPDDHLYVMRRPIETDRMASQQAMFTICPAILGHHGKIISAALPGSNAAIAGKWTIPSEKKTELLAKLRTANITGSSLFPGLDGVGRAALELARVEAAHWASVNGAVAKSPDPDSNPEPTE